MPAAVPHAPRAGYRLPRPFFARTFGALLIGLLLAAAPIAQAGVFRWVDDQGHVHFGDKPPDKQRARSVDVEPSPGPAKPAPNAAERRTKQQRLLRAWEEERRQREEAEADSKQKQARRERNCQVAQDRLRSFRDAGYLYDLDKSGQRRILSDAERETTVKEAEAAVAEWCD